MYETLITPANTMPQESLELGTLPTVKATVTIYVKNAATERSPKMPDAIVKSITLSSGAIVKVAINEENKAFLHFMKEVVDDEPLPIKCWDEVGMRNTLVCISIEALAAVYGLIGDHFRKSDAGKEANNG